MPRFHTTNPSLRPFGAAGGLMAIVLSAGCAPSGDAFASEADAICAKSTSDIKKMREPVTVAEISEMGTVLSKQTSRLGKDLAALNRPGGEEGMGISSFLKDLNTAGVLAKTMSSSAVDKGLPAIEKAVADTKGAYQKADEVWGSCSTRYQLSTPGC